MRNEKQILTKEALIKEMLAENAKSLRYFAAIFAVVTALIGILFWVIYIGIDGKGLHPVVWVIYFAFLTVCLFLPFMLALSLYIEVEQRIALKKGEIIVKTDKVVHKGERLAHSKAHYNEKYVRFCNYGEPKVNQTWYELTDEGDLYYVVFCGKKSKGPSRYYPTKLYEYKE